MHVDDIAKINGCDPVKLCTSCFPRPIFGFVLTRLAGHILRLLATHHIVREVKPDVFGINRISGFMDTGKDSGALFAS